MIEVYGALLLHGAGQQVTEENLKKVIQNAGANVDEAKIKALVSALEGQNIDELIQQAAVVTAPKAEEKKEEEKEEGKKAEEASAGLSALFG